MTPLLIGYLAKHTAKKPEWLGAAGVDEIASMSTCISETSDYVGAWKHNALCYFNDEATAWNILAADEAAGEYDMYAYRLFLTAFDGETEKVIELAELPDFGTCPVDCAPLAAGYQFLGYDCVQTMWAQSVMGFGCSPLSCNGMATEIAVNRYCLIDKLADAVATARQMAREQPEPGVYFIVEVWRKRRDASTP